MIRKRLVKIFYASGSVLCCSGFILALLGNSISLSLVILGALCYFVSMLFDFTRVRITERLLLWKRK